MNNRDVVGRRGTVRVPGRGNGFELFNVEARRNVDEGSIRERLPGHWAIVIDLRSRDWRPARQRGIIQGQSRASRRHSLVDKIGRLVPAIRELSLALLIERTWPPPTIRRDAAIYRVSGPKRKSLPHAQTDANDPELPF